MTTWSWLPSAADKLGLDTVQVTAHPPTSTEELAACRSNSYDC